MKRSRQAAGGFVKRQRVDPVGVLLNRLTRLPIEILNQILRMAVMPSRPAIRYDNRRYFYERVDRRSGNWVDNERRWTGTERMRHDNLVRWFGMGIISYKDILADVLYWLWPWSSRQSPDLLLLLWIICLHPTCYLPLPS